MAAVMTTGLILPPDWLIMKKVAIPAEIAIIATFIQRGPCDTFAPATIAPVLISPRN